MTFYVKLVNSSVSNYGGNETGMKWEGGEKRVKFCIRF